MKYQTSLYLGLLWHIMMGLALAVAIYCSVRIPAIYLIDRYYCADDMIEERHAEHLRQLQSFASRNGINLENSDRLAQWVRDNPYVYLLVYQNSEDGGFSGHRVQPGSKDKLSELAGSRIDEELSRDSLISNATSGGYYNIWLTDGIVIVALAEYSENFYYGVFTAVSLSLAFISFIIVMARYIREIIERIKRFESDVTIVSELDMNYAIVSEGRDEISRLSTNVEKMRCTMLDHIKNEQEARRANTELITSISHDIRTPLTVLMGYIEMMKERGGDETMQSYIEATESTALRLKQLSDDMLKYSLAFGETEKSVRLEDYNVLTLFEQMLSEHIFLLREQGYDIRVVSLGDEIGENSTIRTDAQNLMRIVDNVFSNIVKYADPAKEIVITTNVKGNDVCVEMKNSIRTDTEGAESNKIGLKTCVRLASLVAESFEYSKQQNIFVCRLWMKIKP